MRCKDMVRELGTREVDQVYTSTIRGRPDMWNAELWSIIYGFKQGGEGMATKKDDCTKDKFSQKLYPKYDHFVKKLQGGERKEDVSFLGTYFEPGEALQHHTFLATTLLFAYSKKKVVNWRSIIKELVHRLATSTKRGQPSYIGHFLFQLYAYKNLLTDEEETQWTWHLIMRELQTTDSEPEMDQEYSKEEDVADFSNEERPVSKKMKLMLENLATRTRSATKPGGGRTSTFTLEDNPMDSIIRDLEGVRSRITENELQMQQMGVLMGNPPRESFVAAIQEAIQDPRRLRELERKVDRLTAENRKTTEQVWKLKAEREAFLKQVKDTTLTVQMVSGMVDIPGNMW